MAAPAVAYRATGRESDAARLWSDATAVGEAAAVPLAGTVGVEEVAG